MITVDSDSVPRYFVQRNNCPCCLSGKTSILKEISYTNPILVRYLKSFYREGNVEMEYLKNAFFVLEECLDCGLVFQKQIPDDQLMFKLYDEWLNPHAGFNHEFRFSKRNTIKILDDFYEILRISFYLRWCLGKSNSQLNFFDFGSGWGTWLMRAKLFGIQVFGCEVSQSKATYSGNQGINMIHWYEIPKYKFHFINTEQVFEHIPRPFETLEHLRSSLVDSGILKISVPNGNDIRKRIEIWDWSAKKGSRRSLNPIAPLEHINCYSQKCITKMAESVGLRVIESPKWLVTNLRTIAKGATHFQKSKRPIYLLFKCA